VFQVRGALLCRDFVQRVVSDGMQHGLAFGGFHTVEMQLMDMTLRQFVEG
jgi:hypothetical protein